MDEHARREIDEPINQFSQCHAGLKAHLSEMRALPGLLQQAQRARAIAERTLELFRDAVLQHHADEEKELFPAVLLSAQPGEEAIRVERIVERLTSEHRSIEARWKQMEHAVRDAAHGKPAALDEAAVGDLVDDYVMHADYEEETFLPLAAAILGRNSDHMAALGLSLHIRHSPPMPAPYI